MKKISLFFSLIIALTLTASAQMPNAKTLFAKIPDSVLPFLTSVNRADFIDFLESKMKAQVKNKFGNTSEMTDLTPDFIRIKTSSLSTWEMKLLALNDTTQIICAVSTACGPACDSNIQFYSAEWKELPVPDYLIPPVMDDFFNAPDSAGSDEYNTLRLKADILLVKAELSKENNTLTFEFTTPQYMETDSRDQINAFLRNPLIYQWEGVFRKQ